MFRGLRCCREVGRVGRVVTIAELSAQLPLPPLGCVTGFCERWHGCTPLDDQSQM